MADQVNGKEMDTSPEVKADAPATKKPGLDPEGELVSKMLCAPRHEKQKPSCVYACEGEGGRKEAQTHAGRVY